MKVICPGYFKTGTKTMREALEILGYENVHDICEQVKFDYEILKKALGSHTAVKEDFQKAYQDVDAITDIPGIFIWKELMDAFPESKIVLVVRDTPEVWLDSFKNMIDIERKNMVNIRHYRLMQMLFRNRFCPNFAHLAELREYIMPRVATCGYDWKNLSFDDAKQKYIEHNEAVIKGCPKHRLLVFKAHEGWGPLCEFLGKEIPNTPFPHLNKKHIVVHDPSVIKYDAGMQADMKREVRNMMLIYAAIFTIVVAVIFRLFCVM